MAFAFAAHPFGAGALQAAATPSALNAFCLTLLYSAGTRKGRQPPMARPSKFKLEFIEQAEKLCRLGATDVEIADFFEVDVRTLYRWKGEQEAFCHALKAGKDVSDERVERSLFARANGYEHEEVDIRVVGGELVQTPIRKFYPPDTAAAIFWLKNRRPDAWREKIDHTLANPDGTALSLTVEFVKPK